MFLIESIGTFTTGLTGEVTKEAVSVSTREGHRATDNAQG